MGLLALVLFFVTQAPANDLTPSQRESLEHVLAWMQTHSGRMPTAGDFGGSLPERIPCRYSRLVGCDVYREDGPQAHLAVFPNAQVFWRTLHHLARERGLPFRLLDIRFKHELTPETRKILKDEAVQLVLDWRLKAGRSPRSSDFKTGGGPLPIDYNRLVALNEYKSGMQLHGWRIFDSRQAFDEALDLQWRTLPEALRDQASKACLQHQKQQREQIQQQAIDLVLTWYRTHHYLPHPLDFSSGEFPFTYAKLTGAWHKCEERAIFSSPEDFWLALHTRGLADGVEIPLLKIHFTRYPEKLLHVLRAQANTLVLNWILSHRGLVPHSDDFNTRYLPLSYYRLMGVGTFAPNQRFSHLALFPGTQEFWLQFKAYARNQHYDFRLLDVSFRSELKPELRLQLREEALNLYVTWSQQHGRQPTLSDFHRRLMPLSAARLFYVAAKESGEEKLFSSFKEFDEALTARLAHASACTMWE